MIIASPSRISRRSSMIATRIVVSVTSVMRISSSLVAYLFANKTAALRVCPERRHHPFRTRRRAELLNHLAAARPSLLGRHCSDDGVGVVGELQHTTGEHIHHLKRRRREI